MGLADEVVAKFPKNSAIGGFLTWPDVAALTECISERHIEPGFGAPRGWAEWPDAFVFVEVAPDEETSVREGDHRAVISRLRPGTHLETDPRRLDPERTWARLALVRQPAVVDLRNAQDRAFYGGSRISQEAEARLETLSEWGVEAVFHPEDARLELVTPAVLEQCIWPVDLDHAVRNAPCGANP